MNQDSGARTVFLCHPAEDLVEERECVWFSFRKSTDMHVKHDNRLAFGRHHPPLCESYLAADTAKGLMP